MITTYEIEVLNEYGNIIHHHYYESFSKDDAEENARKSCRWHGGYDWRVIKIK